MSIVAVGWWANLAVENAVKTGKTFEFVLFAEDASDSKEHRARILKGEVGTTRVRELMAAAMLTN